jgi:hypothetical protein
MWTAKDLTCLLYARGDSGWIVNLGSGTSTAPGSREAGNVLSAFVEKNAEETNNLCLLPD